MESNWLQNEFIWKELRAPYIINYDTDYYETLKDKYEILLNQAIKAKADEESIEIIKNYKKKSKNLPFKLERVIILTKFPGQKSEKRPRIIVILHIKSKPSL